MERKAKQVIKLKVVQTIWIKREDLFLTLKSSDQCSSLTVWFGNAMFLIENTMLKEPTCYRQSNINLMYQILILEFVII